MDEQQFRRDVERHEVTIHKDDGLYRHLRCQIPGSWCMGFDIVTYPGYLVFSGDMGSFVFSRVADMFNFFGDGKPVETAIEINPRYWAEKVQAGDRCNRGDGVEQFSAQLFRRHVIEWVQETGLSDVDREEILNALEHEVFSEAEDYGEDEGIACAALHRFNDERVCFTDFFGSRLREYTHRFLWCCYALVWAIRQYDQIKQHKEAA